MDIRKFFGGGGRPTALGQARAAAAAGKTPTRTEGSNKADAKTRRPAARAAKHKAEAAGHDDEAPTKRRRTAAKVVLSDEDDDAEEPLPKEISAKASSSKGSRSKAAERPASSSHNGAAAVRRSPRKHGNTPEKDTRDSPPKQTKVTKKAPAKRVEVSAADFFNEPPAKSKRTKTSKAEQPRGDVAVEKPQEAKALRVAKPAKHRPPAVDMDLDKVGPAEKTAAPVDGAKADTDDDVVPDTPPPPPQPKATASAKRVSPRKHRTPEKAGRTAHKTATPAGALQPTPKASSPPKDAPHSASKQQSYQAFLNREGPRALGTKELPAGTPTCLGGMTFVMTGVLECVERDDAKALIEKHGGRVTGSVSRKTTYLLLGRDAGVSKTNKAEQLGVKTVDEDGLFQLIRDRSKSSSSSAASKQSPANGERKAPQRTAAGGEGAAKAAASDEVDARPAVVKPVPARPAKADLIEPAEQQLQWVDKYKPTQLKQVVGQHGEKSPVNKLLNWLKNWEKWFLSGEVGSKPRKAGYRPPTWGSRANDDGGSVRSALLSGPPGIGKTTAAHLCCEQLGLGLVELNASDVRSKKSLEASVGELVGTRQMDEFLPGRNKDKCGGGGKRVRHVLIMDEVDGMSGNEDRAGMQELISLIKTSKIPIICICNDRQSQKIRSLANHCFDLRFQRPRVEQIRGRLMTICQREGLKLLPQTLDQIIEGANHDLRQAINHLNLIAIDRSELDFDTARQCAKEAKKDVEVNTFEAARKLLQSGTSIAEKSELFFMDYRMMPLFVQQNYVDIMPHGCKKMADRLKSMAAASDYMTLGDVADRMIRTTGSWNLLNEQCMFSSVLPVSRMCGHLTAQMAFPKWLGNNSSRNKRMRLLQQLHGHVALHVSANLESMQTDYVGVLRDRITQPLIDGDEASIRSVVETYEAYDLLRDDAEAIHELADMPEMATGASKIASKTKSALTRHLNKSHRLLPFAAEGDARVAGARPAGKGRRQQQQPAAGFGDELMVDEEGKVVRDDAADTEGDDDGTVDDDEAGSTVSAASSAASSSLRAGRKK